MNGLLEEKPQKEKEEKVREKGIQRKPAVVKRGRGGGYWEEDRICSEVS